MTLFMSNEFIVVVGCLKLRKMLLTTPFIIKQVEIWNMVRPFIKITQHLHNFNFCCRVALFDVSDIIKISYERRVIFWNFSKPKMSPGQNGQSGLYMPQSFAAQSFAVASLTLGTCFWCFQVLKCVSTTYSVCWWSIYALKVVHKSVNQWIWLRRFSTTPQFWVFYWELLCLLRSIFALYWNFMYTRYDCD
jgi:hypothetical protein